MKKTIIIGITIIVLIILILFGIFYMKNKELSKDEFILLLKSFNQVSNVKIEGNLTRYIKDEYMLSMREDGLYTWTNSKTKECISYFPSLKEYMFLDYNDGDITGLEDSEYTFIRI